MEELEVKIKIITIIIILVWTILQFLLWVITKIVKRRKEQINELNDETKENINDDISFLEVVEKIIPEAIKFAENCGIMTGEAKKLLATSKIMTEMATKGIDYNSHAAEISKDIDNLVDMSKSVNVKNNANQIKEE